MVGEICIYEGSRFELFLRVNFTQWRNVAFYFGATFINSFCNLDKNTLASVSIDSGHVTNNSFSFSFPLPTMEIALFES